MVSHRPHKSLLRLLGLAGLILALLLPACTGAPATTPTPVVGGVRVAMVLPGKRDDHSWSEAGFAALQSLRTTYRADVFYAEEVHTDRALEILRGYAEAGHDLIVGHGSEYSWAMEQVAQDHPRGNFALMTAYPGNNANLGGLSFADDEVGYLLGYIAGLKSKAGHVGILFGMEQESTRAQAIAFEAGAKAANPATEVSVIYAGSWTDRDATRAGFDTLVAAGADVLALNIDTDVVEMHRQAERLGLRTIGFNLDVHQYAPRAVITSVIFKMDTLLREAVRLVQQGRWEGRLYRLGLRDGAFELAPFYGALSQEEQARVEAVRRDILQGKAPLSR